MRGGLLLKTAGVVRPRRHVFHGSKQRQCASCATEAPLVEVHCVRLAHNGQGVCFEPSRERVTFVTGAVPGETLKAQLHKEKKSFAEGIKRAVVAPPPGAVVPPCPYVESCSGCSLQTLQYTAQLAAKADRLLFELGRLFGEARASQVFSGSVPCPSPFRYRNKTSFALTPVQHPDPGRPAYAHLGMRQWQNRGVTPVKSCMLQSTDADAVLGALNSALVQLPASTMCYNPRVRRGFIKRITLRHGFGSAAAARQAAAEFDLNKVPLPLLQHTKTPGRDPSHAAAPDHCSSGNIQAVGDSVLVDIWTHGLGSRKEREALLALCRAVQDDQQVAGIVQSVHLAQNISAPPTEVLQLSGNDHVYVALGSLVCRASVRSFLQVNTAQCALLYRVLEELASLRSSDTVLDLYCGAGTIALWLARHCSRVIGIECVEKAVWDARENAALNNVTNATFVVADLAKRHAAQVLDTEGAAAADVIVVDPARVGLSPEVVQFLGSAPARAIVYVSCNSQSMCRDIAALQKLGWQCVHVRAVDMFPQTDHLECVVRLERVADT